LRGVLLAALFVLLAAAAAGAGSSAQNQAAAAADADSLMAAPVLPADATALAAEPDGDGGVLARSAADTADPNAVTRTAWFRSGQGVSAVLAYADAHRPSGALLLFSGDGETRAGHRLQTRAYQRPPIPGRLGRRWLIVSATQLDDGSTGIRVDAQVVWLFPRPLGLTIRGARHLTINSGHHKIVITNGARVRRIAALFNRLDIQQPTPIVFCPIERTSDAHPRLTFRSRAGGKVIAYAHVRPTGCPRADMVVGGVRYSGLDLSSPPGARLLDVLEKLGAL
jgi:hypothetical protein